MGSQKRQKKICDICSTLAAAAKCEGCGKSLCRNCRSMEIYGSKDLDITIKYFCPECSKDPKINPSTGCKKVLGLEDITDMVNQDNTKSNRFKIKLKI